MKNIKISIKYKLWNSLSDPIWDIIAESTNDYIFSSCSRLLWSYTNKYVGGSVWTPVRNKIKDNMDNIRISVLSTIKNSVDNYNWGIIKDSINNTIRYTVYDYCCKTNSGSFILETVVDILEPQLKKI